ncbi:ABC transporter ATP-binding protein [Alkalihalobacillus sp. BA299]|uniref:ABC transporter ATP-binding protein n=1 Tax=Alkalihalobacillus sp. BA299 TaxID=2815938 RepID=UPI001ADAEC85|nr:ABC transporter ATP-binding protein [Alkalihalobacillus sp. BA299]
MGYIAIKQLTKRFEASVAVDQFSLEIKEGEFISFLGPSGCGKTTTLRMIAGFIDPTEGEIQIDEQVVFSKAKRIGLQPEERNIGMVFQSYAVWPHMTVYQNIAYPLKIKKVNKKAMKERVERMLDLVNLQDYKKRYPHELSGGQQQRVALARALIMEPSLLLLDEPLSNLDAKLREKMRAEIIDVQKRTGVTIVYVTHDQAEALSMSDRIVVMNKGVIQQIGSPEEIYKEPINSFVADFIGQTNFISGQIKSITPLTIQLESTDMQITMESEPFSQSYTVGQNVSLCIRPEEVKIVESSDERKSLQGTIVNKTYLGNVIEYIVNVDHQHIRVEADSSSNWALGVDVGLQMKQSIIFTKN